MQTPLNAGSIIGSKYRVDKVLGRGGFGVVYLCKDLQLLQTVVLKECYPDDPDLNLVRDGDEICAADEKSLSLFVEEYKLKAEAEAAMLGKINHDNIVKVNNIVKANGTVYIVMPYVEGDSFASVIRKYKSNNKNLSEEFLRHVLKKTLEAIRHVHSLGLVHKDIKPDNIIITPGNKPVLIDFGAARSRARMISQGHTMICSSGYSPPESKDPNTVPDARYDIYSIGAAFYEAVTGFAPTDSDIRKYRDDTLNLSESYAGQYSRAFLSGINKALSIARSNRFSDAEEWLNYLNSAPAEPDRAPLLGYPQSYAAKKSAQAWQPASAGKAETEKNEMFLLCAGALVMVGFAASVFAYNLFDGRRYRIIQILILILFEKGIKYISKNFKSGSFLLLCSGDAFEFSARNSETVLVGRSSDCNIHIPDSEKYRAVSRKHFALTRRGGGFLIENMKGEENPIFIKGEEILSAKEIDIGEAFSAGGLNFKIGRK